MSLNMSRNTLCTLCSNIFLINDGPYYHSGIHQPLLLTDHLKNVIILHCFGLQVVDDGIVLHIVVDC